MLTTITKYMLNREIDRATTALDQTREDRAHAEQLVARRERITQRLDDVLKATARP